MSDLAELEAQAAASRERLNDTIGRIQDKLTIAGLVDEVAGQTRATRLVGDGDLLSGLLRRHPLPLMIAAAGLGLLIHRMSRRRPAPVPVEDDVDVPALNTGRARIYDPDAPARHPLADGAARERIEA